MGNFTKTGWWALLLTGCLMSGCVGGPLPKNAAWPWEHTKDTGNYQTGDYATIRGNVANFDEPPKAAKPVSPESLAPPVPDSGAVPETAVAKTQPPPLTGPGQVTDSAKKEYDFGVRDIQLAPPSYLPEDAIRSAYDITAFNHGGAPVSVSIGIDPLTSRNITTDRTLPFNAVVAPNSVQALVRVAPKMKNERYSFRHSYTWNIGDFTAIHNCPEHYRFPFGSSVKALASANDTANPSAYTRNAVFFSVPAGTPVLAARKGRVVQVKTDRIDVLHDDATIATYGHLGRIADGITAGKNLSTEDVIGEAGAIGNQNEAYIQLTVWRPEPLPAATAEAASRSAGFEFVSFPLEFCSTGSSDCRVITRDQMVSRNVVTDVTKQGKRKAKRRTGSP